MSEKIQKILKKLPSSSGIYQFFDENGEIIYIGKSINLKNRVNSYFKKNAKLNFAKKKMINKIEDIKIIVVNNETESLILETNLIKTHKPKYNILMKDDKNHLYIKITKEDFPKIIKTRIKSKSGIYFGPYLSSAYVEQILKFIKKYFGYGIGEHHFFHSKNSYNLDKYLFKLPHSKTTLTFRVEGTGGQGSSKVEEKEIYSKKISQIIDFLKNDYKKIIPTLEKEMQDFAKKLEFERAGETKKTIEALKTLEINQIVRDSIAGNYDIINYLEKYDRFFIAHIILRDGKIIGMQNFEIENKLEENKKVILQKFIEQNIISKHLEEGKKEKVKILMNETSPQPSSLEEREIATPLLLSKEKGLGDKVLIEIPKIGPKKELLELAYKNIYEYAHKKHLSSLSTKGFTKKNMVNLLNILNYKQINKNIIFECYDISHISGNHTVASRSIIENGKINTSKYKKYKIKTLKEQKIDDFASMREVISRRLKEIENLENIPDLIIIDGGKGQLGSVIQTIASIQGLVSSLETKHGPLNTKYGPLQIVSIAKKEEELFLPYKKESIILDKNSSELRLVQNIRDEAHRFAITFNRDSRIKAMKKNILESLPGFGIITRKKILKAFGNVENLKNIEKKELKKYLNKNQIEVLENHGII